MSADNPLAARTLRIRALNDAARAGLPHGFAHCLVTRGVSALPVEQVAQILEAVRTYSTFTEDNDPHGEHDFGVLTRTKRDGCAVWTSDDVPESHDGYGADKVFWKIDYYARAADGVPAFSLGSEDPADAAKTARVMTIYLASEH